MHKFQLIVLVAVTLIIHPATTTHSRVDARALVDASITQDMIRLSVGLEDVDDIMAGFGDGFRASKKVAKS
ncbi:MAG: PLP-dependent transferase [Xanthomonadales bacterium]